MKLLGKNRDEAPDGALDRLLRANVSRPSNRGCSEFDADLATSYIERSLTADSRSHYEQHLFECTPCRKNVIALSRLTEAELRPAASLHADSRPQSRTIFGLASLPRWTMAAAAVIVLAISLPLLLTRTSNPATQGVSPISADSPAADNSQAINQAPGMSSPAAAKASAGTGLGSSESKASEKHAVDAVSSNSAVAAQQPAGSGGDRASVGGKLEAKAEPKPAEPVQVASGAQSVSDVAAGQPQEEKRLDKNNALSARQQPPAKDAAAADSKTGGSEQDQQNAKEKTRVAESVASPPPPAAPGTKAARLKRQSAIRALRDSGPAESVRPTEKKVGNKKFLFKNDTWTDKDFDPDKDLPVVTVIRDSNVYIELLGKQAGLRTYLGGFAGTDRAIIVYKGTVYKLIPQ
jgi:hypothetical protein